MTIPSNFISEGVQYFENLGKEVDYENEGIENAVTFEEYDHICKILTCEVSYYLLRRSYGICESLSDQMVEIKRELINDYERVYKTKYTYPNEEIEF